MAYENTEAAKDAVYTAIGMKDGGFKGMWICVDVTELYTTGWRAKATGRFQVRISTPYRGRGARDTILRTRKELNNEFDLVAVKAAVEEYVRIKTAQNVADKARVNTATANKSIVERIVELYKGKNYLSEYSSGSCAIFPSEHEEGKIHMKWDFRSVDEVTAEKIINFINENNL